MPAYLIAHVKPKDPEKMQAYASQAGPTLAKFGGKPITRARVAEVLCGQHEGAAALIAEFPDAKTIHEWYHSPDYQALIPLREEALDATFVVLEEPPQ